MPASKTNTLTGLVGLSGGGLVVSKQALGSGTDDSDGTDDGGETEGDDGTSDGGDSGGGDVEIDPPKEFILLSIGWKRF